jgi:glutamate synthase (NADPH/NADH) small chain
MSKQGEERTRNFQEVALGFTPQQAKAEAARCLQCPKRFCATGCPVGIQIPDFIKLIRQGDFLGAAKKIKEKNSLPAICGRVCPQENQCELKCILQRKGQPIAIGALERFVADWEREHNPPSPEPAKQTIGKVAVVGSGPAGLTAAAQLAKACHRVTVFEALHAVGGVLRYGIPQFRLPKEILEAEVEYIKGLGVEIQTNVLIGQTISFSELQEQYDAIFIATGAGLPHFLGIPGENLPGVYSANEFLTRVNLMRAFDPGFDTPIKIGQKVAVIGAGNVAMDAARTALRLGADKVSIVYRRSWEEMPARLEERENAKEEGIEFRLLTNPVAILEQQDRPRALKCVKMELGAEDSTGRRKPIPIPGSEFEIPVETVIVAVGQGPNPVLVRNAPQLARTQRGYFSADPETGKTNLEGVWAGGDIVTGAATVIAAMGAAKRAAKEIDEYIQRKKGI